MRIEDSVVRALLPRYAVIRVIGRGGMATVYLADDLEAGRQVAVKVLDSEVASEVDPLRFEREIRIAGALKHPNILPLLDSGTADGLLYFVMPYVDGESLRERLTREGQMDVDEVLRIAKAVAAGLDYAHGQSVIHRDIKPENILLSDQDVFVADFGIARVLTDAESERFTTTRRQVGTPVYASPEQSAGERRIDGRADVYSLGCVLYEMLAGEPPFTGPSARAVIARHITAPPPDLSIVRPGASPSILAAVRRALSKVPADRFASAGELARALESPRPVRVPGDAEPADGRMRIALVTVAVAALALLATQFWPNTPELDARKVVVFPLGLNSQLYDAAVGWDVALAIGAALEHTEPLRFIDSYAWLDADVKADPSQLTADVARRIAVARGAAHYIDGAIHGTADSTQVTVRLYDVAGDSLIAQETEQGRAGAGVAAQLSLRAMSHVLGALVDPGVEVDLTPLTDRSLAANALAIQGDREYRQSRFAAARDFYARALEEDSLHVFAAIKAAQSAGWLSDFEDDSEFITRALANADLLPGKYRSFAEGVHAFLAGDAAGAVASLRDAMEQDDEWREGAMALGDTYYHLLPDDNTAPDSIAGYWLERARQLDSTFGPPIFHLAEIALRRGDLIGADSLLTRWQAFRPDEVLSQQLRYSLDCLEAEPGTFDWTALALDAPRPVLQAGLSLAGGASQIQCAHDAFDAILRNPGLQRSLRFTALEGMFGLAMARGRYQEADSLLRAGLEAPDLSAAVTLYVYGAIAGGPFEDETARAEARLRAPPSDDIYTGRPAGWRWLMGVALERTGELQRLAALVGDMSRLGEERRDRETALLARALNAHLLAARGDTAEAIRVLGNLVPDAPRADIAFSDHEALAPERLLLAKLLLETGDPNRAFRTASLLDHPVPLIHTTFLRPSLMIRLAAAEAMGNPRLAASVRARLEALDTFVLAPRPTP